MSDPRLTDCPACGAASLHKQVTAASFKLKGTGWYETDFKNSGKKPVESKSSATTSKDGASVEKPSTEKSGVKPDAAGTAGGA